MSEWKLAPLVANLEMQNAGWREADRQGLDLESVEMQPIYQAMLAEAPQPQKEPVVWGAPKTVRQLIGQLETLDPDLETVALYRLPDGLGELSGKVKQGHISTSYERMEGIWLGPYKGSGRKVLAFWTKLDPREVPDGDPLTQPTALGGEPEVLGYRIESPEGPDFAHADTQLSLAYIASLPGWEVKPLIDRAHVAPLLAKVAELERWQEEVRNSSELLRQRDAARAERDTLKALIDQVRAIAEDRAKGYASREHGGVLNGRCMDKLCALFEGVPAAKDGAQ